MDSNEVVGWGTNKNEGGTFQGTVYTFKSLKDIDPETGTYCTKHKLIFNREFKTRGAVVAIYEPSEDLPDLDMNGWSISDVHESYNELFGGFDYERVTVSSGEVLVVLDECDYIAVHLLDTDKMVDGIVDNTCRHFGGWKKMYPHLVV